MPVINPYDLAKADPPPPAPKKATTEDVAVQVQIPKDLFLDIALEAANNDVTLSDYIVHVLREEVSF